MARHPENIIARRLGGGFAFIILLFISFGFHYYYQTDLLSDLTYSIYNHPLFVSNAANEGKICIIQIHRDLDNLSNPTTETAISEEIAEISDLEQRFIGHLDLISQKILGENGRQLERKARRQFREWQKTRQKILLLIRDGKHQAAAETVSTECFIKLTRLEKQMEAIAAYARNKADQFRRKADTTHAKMHLFTTAYIIAGILISMLIAYITIRTVMAAERKSFENLELLHAILDGVDDLIHVKDVTGRWILSNTATAEALDKKPNELIGKNNNDLLPEDFLLQADVTDQQVIQSGEPISFERKMQVNGSTITYLAKKTPLQDRNGAIIGVITVARDITEKAKYSEELERQVKQRTAGLVEINTKLEREITERKLKTRALKESEHKYSTLVNNTIIGIFIVQDGVIRYANPRFAQIFGYMVDELTGMDPALLIHPDEREKFNSDLVATTTHKDNKASILRQGLTRDHNLCWLEVQNTVISYQSKPAILGNVVDITRRKELEHLLNIQDKMASRGRVAAGMAHELRNPLSGMNIHLSNLERLSLRFDTLEPDQQKKLTRIIENLKIASTKIESVIKRVYDFSKPGRFNLVRIDVNRAINTVIDISSPALRKKGISITKQLDNDLPTCYSDQNLFEQLLMNLLTNASQILERINLERKILITSKAVHTNIVITVADSGPGIEEHVKNKIFDPFYSSKKDGLGIGLSICYRIVKDHDGELTLGTSKELGGAEFTISLPLNAHEKGL